MENSYPSYDDLQQAREQLRQLSYQHWIHHDLLTWRWWLLLTLTIVPWIIWWRVANKSRRQETLLYGALIAIFAISLDDVGTHLLWWGYPDKLFQSIPPLIPADLTLVPVFMMLVYQLLQDWKLFLSPILH
ncbi:CBO0543 family protein [Paenibacillus cremeus]|uniref:CBO0543 family protein n=1 Tax=Paenibacillus cremeus TaxID=2163881 RepID=UPI0011A0750F|nr:CBO0543 family protein [Paenibacillus cremeus]